MPTNKAAECQQSNPKPFSCYASAPNDVWSLGVILVNLTCGRNPWKRASMTDATFRAFMRDRNFLQTILPISDGLNCILQRIFEADPKRRISLDALRDAISFCPQLSQDPVDSLPPSPDYSPVAHPVDAPTASYDNGLEPVPNMDSLPAQQYPQPFPTVQFNSAQPPQGQGNLLTPPGSNPGSPRQSLYPYNPRPVPAVVGNPFATQVAFLPGLPSWQRCSNFVPSLAQHACWRNMSVF